MRSPLGTTNRFASDHRGIATVELAMVLLLLTTLLAGMVELGIGMWMQNQVGNSARAGAAYAAAHGFNSTAIQTAANRATSLGSVATTVTQSCGCPGTNTITTATCGGTCASGATVGTYVKVLSTANYIPMVTAPGLVPSYVLSASTITRIN